MEIILTPAQAKTARTQLGLSQGKIATMLNMNRSYLSQFENGKYILNDSDLERLRIHYESEGYDFDNTLGAVPQISDTDRGNQDSSARIIDGFLVPEYIAQDQIEDLLFEYESNIQKINQLCTYDIRKNHTKRPWFEDPYIDNADVQQLTNDIAMSKIIDSIKHLFLWLETSISLKNYADMIHAYPLPNSLMQTQQVILLALSLEDYRIKLLSASEKTMQHK